MPKNHFSPQRRSKAAAPTASTAKTSAHLWWAPWVCAIALAAACLVTLGPVIGCGFVNYDDDAYVTENHHVQAGLTAEGFRWAWTTTHAANWHPLTWLSLMLDTELFGTAPLGYHLGNLALHLANTLVLFAVLVRATGAVWRSALVAALFALHPLHVESVAWISERKDVLSTFFGLLAVLAYIHYVEAPGVGRYTLVMVCFAGSLLAKPMLVTLPCLLLLLDYWPLRRWRPGGVPAQPEGAAGAQGTSLWWLILEKVPLAAFTIASSLATLVAQHAGGAVQSLEAYPFSDRVGNAVVSYGQYLRQALFPVDLAPYYPHPRSELSLQTVVAVGAVLGAVTVLVLWRGRRHAYLPVGWLWFLGTLIPVVGLVQVGGQARADRYTYFPLVGIFLLLVWSAAELVRRPMWKALLGAGAVAAVSLCAVLSWVQVQNWRNSLTLWQHTVRTTDRNHVAHNNLGMALLEQGRVDEAIPEFRTAVSINPNDYRAHNNLAAIGLMRRQFSDAAFHALAAIRAAPNDPKGYLNLAVVRFSEGEYGDAVSMASHAARLDPKNAQAQHALGLALEMRTGYAEAIPYLRRASELQPRVATYRFDLGLALYEQGFIEQAQAEYQEALRLNPDWPRGALRSAWTLAAHPAAANRNGRMALRLAQQLRHVSGDENPHVLDLLAAAHAEEGNFTEAVNVARAARARAEASGLVSLVRQIEQRLRLYENKQPFRGVQPEIANQTS